MTDPDRDASAEDRPRHDKTVVIDLAAMQATPVGEYAARNLNK
nr:hypothetical protein [Mycobacterium sp. UM_NZ2]